MSLILGPIRMPPPFEVIIRVFEIFIYSNELVMQGAGGRNIVPHLTYTITRTLSGFACGGSLGIILGIVLGRNKATREFVELPLEGLRAIPPLGLIPFLLMWFGPTAITQFILITSYTFFVTTIYTRNAVRNVNPIYIQLAKTLGANNSNILRTVIVPAILPELIGGLRVALAMSFGIEVLSELMGAPYGMGKFFWIMIPFLNTRSLFAGILVIILVALFFDKIFMAITSYLIRWVPKENI